VPLFSLYTETCTFKTKNGSKSTKSTSSIEAAAALAEFVAVFNQIGFSQPQ
jgi:hypothetical protein